LHESRSPMKAADLIIKHRIILTAIMLVLAVSCAVLTAFVPINHDRTQYLADNSNMKQGLSIMQSEFPDGEIGFSNEDIPSTEVPMWILLCAAGLMIIILLIMCDSWLEPVLILATVGIAVLINTGTNIVFPFIDELTFSIGPVIQLVLSLDYSIILIHRYLQEKARHPDRLEAMKAAITSSISSIASSALTTAVGLLTLVFLSFKLGPELGIVLAKGVLISLICVLAILPTLILFSDRWLEKTKKRSPHIPMGFFAAFSRKTRYVMPGIFLVLFVVFCILQSFTQISFLEKDEMPASMSDSDENQVVLIYRSADEDRIENMMENVTRDERITEVLGYYNTLGKAYPAEEMSIVIKDLGDGVPVSDEMLRMLYVYYRIRHGSEEMTIPQLFDFVSNELMTDPQLAPFFPQTTKDYILDQQTALKDGLAQMKGPVYSRLVITSDYPEESPETLAYIERLRQQCGESLEEYYLVGTSVMAGEMNDSFENEHLMITLITAAAIFLVVLIAFRNPILPLILTLLVQCGVFITVTVIGALSGSIYYLALLIVQSILMGATIDYGIVFCSFYKECRQVTDMAGALKQAYERSIHTIMTSGSILVLVLAAIGTFAPSSMIRTVSITLSIGSVIAIFLILFVLPGVTACFDRFILSGKKTGQ